METEKPIISRLLQREQLSREELFNFLNEELEYLFSAYGLTFQQALIDQRITLNDSLAMRNPVDLEDSEDLLDYRQEMALLIAIKQWFSRFHSTSAYKD